LANKFLRIGPLGNHSFTGIVNHTDHRLRGGKGSLETISSHMAELARERLLLDRKPWTSISVLGFNDVPEGIKTG
jgi:hypothetical protein